MKICQSSAIYANVVGAQLNGIFDRCAGAYSDITLRGYRRDLEIFATWREHHGESILPASPLAVSAFLNEQLAVQSYATLRRRVSAIKFLHRMSDLPSPVEHSEVYLCLCRVARLKGRRPRQVKGLMRSIKSAIIKACPDTLIGYRDAALIGLGYDTLCRSSELSWMMVDHVDLEGRTAYICARRVTPLPTGVWHGFRRIRPSPWDDGLMRQAYDVATSFVAFVWGVFPLAQWRRHPSDGSSSRLQGAQALRKKPSAA